MASKGTGKGKKGTAAKKKTAKSGAAKKKTTKASPKASGTRSARSTKKTVQEKRTVERNPVYILAILILLSVIVVLVNRSYHDGDKDTAPPGRIVENDVKKGKDARNISKDNVSETSEKKSVENTADKRDESKSPGLTRSDVNVYFIRFNENSEKRSLVPIKRSVNTDSPVKGALNELLKGPGKRDKGRGLLSAIPENLKIRDVKIRGTNAVIDFNSVIEENANGNILLMRIDQIVYTATQFKGIDSVLIKINGKRKRFLGGEGLSIDEPISRRR